MSAIELHARATTGFEQRVDNALAVLREAAKAHAGRVVQATSLGAEDMVITDLIARHGLPIAIATLDTGKLHAETLALIPRIQARYGLAVEVFAPVGEQVVHFVRANGEEPMYRSVELRKACCGVRKLETLGRMLDGRSAWVTGLRREQSEHRAVVPFSEAEANGRIKFNPLANWSSQQVWNYIRDNDVPYNVLHERGFVSIGCEPCTRPIRPGEHERAGRWWWEEETMKECGLHAGNVAKAS